MSFPKKYFHSKENRNWIFSSESGKSLFYASYVPIVRHRKIIGKAHPYDPDFKEYFIKRNKINAVKYSDATLKSYKPNWGKCASD